jgi:hypothetical protein
MKWGSSRSGKLETGAEECRTRCLLLLGEYIPLLLIVVVVLDVVLLLLLLLILLVLLIV